MELPKRKNIRLKHYDYSSDGAYFITVCVKGKHQMLGKIVGDGVLDVPKMQLSEYGIIVENQINLIDITYDSISINKYVIMPDHIHMIIFVCSADSGTSRRSCPLGAPFDQPAGMPSGGTSRTPSPTNAIIPSIISTFKRFINKTCGFSMFQRSFHDRIIRNEQEYLGIWEYIDKNPLTWAIGEHDEWHPTTPK